MMAKFDFEEINLIPKKSIVNSRSECDTSVEFGGFKFKLPVIPANMECVIDYSLAEKLASNGYFYIMHRFIDTLDFVEYMNNKNLLVSISVGVNQPSYDLISQIVKKKLKVNFITVDIAHGHSIKMEKMLKFLKENIDSYIIAGNVSTSEAVIELNSWGADCIKVGIGPGSACTTWPMTGFGSRNCQASTIKDCSNHVIEGNIEIPIIADGGIRCPGDIAKSIVLGASMVMVGGMLSGFNDSPGNLIETEEGLKKEFWGSASSFQSNKKNRIEGKKLLLNYKDKSILDELIHIEESLQSSISYGGGNKLNDLNFVKWH